MVTIKKSSKKKTKIKTISKNVGGKITVTRFGRERRAAAKSGQDVSKFTESPRQETPPIQSDTNSKKGVSFISGAVTKVSKGVLDKIKAAQLKQSQIRKAAKLTPEAQQREFGTVLVPQTVTTTTITTQPETKFTPGGRIEEDTEKRSFVQRLRMGAEKSEQETAKQRPGGFAGKAFTFSAVAGATEPIRHPIQFTKDIISLGVGLVTNPRETGSAIKQSLIQRPSSFLGTLTGQGLFFRTAPKVVKKLPVEVKKVEVGSTSLTMIQVPGISKKVTTLGARTGKNKIIGIRIGKPGKDLSRGSTGLTVKMGSQKTQKPSKSLEAALTRLTQPLSKGEQRLAQLRKPQDINLKDFEVVAKVPVPFIKQISKKRTGKSKTISPGRTARLGSGFNPAAINKADFSTNRFESGASQQLDLSQGAIKSVFPEQAFKRRKKITKPTISFEFGEPVILIPIGNNKVLSRSLSEISSSSISSQQQNTFSLSSSFQKSKDLGQRIRFERLTKTGQKPFIKS